MAHNHLTGFLADVKAINHKFHTFTSSLKGLVDHLQKTVSEPEEMTAEEAYGFCKGRSSRRLLKYEPAIERLVSVWGKGGVGPYPQTNIGSSLRQLDIRRICFRGDSRSPADIFSSGFHKREPEMSATYRQFQISQPDPRDPYRYPIDGFRKAGDLDPDSAVCVTPDMHVAALFPLPTADTFGSEIWIYMVFMNRGYNTNGRQVLDALTGLEELKSFETKEVSELTVAELRSVRVAEIMQNLYGREMAADSIGPKHIWYAFKARRTWSSVKTWTSPDGVIRNKPDYKSGGSYEIVETVENEFAEYPTKGTWRTAASFFVSRIADGIKAKSTYTMPTSREGFTNSDVRSLIETGGNQANN